MRVASDLIEDIFLLPMAPPLTTNVLSNGGTLDDGVTLDITKLSF